MPNAAIDIISIGATHLLSAIIPIGATHLLRLLLSLDVCRCLRSVIACSSHSCQMLQSMAVVQKVQSKRCHPPYSVFLDLVASAMESPEISDQPSSGSRKGHKACKQPTLALIGRGQSRGRERGFARIEQGSQLLAEVARTSCHSRPSNASRSLGVQSAFEIPSIPYLPRSTQWATARPPFR